MQSRKKIRYSEGVSGSAVAASHQQSEIRCIFCKKSFPSAEIESHAKHCRNDTIPTPDKWSIDEILSILQTCSKERCEKIDLILSGTAGHTGEEEEEHEEEESHGALRMMPSTPSGAVDPISDGAESTSHNSRNFDTRPAMLCFVCCAGLDSGPLLHCSSTCGRFFHIRCLALATPLQKSGENWVCPECARDCHECFHCGKYGFLSGRDMVKSKCSCGWFSHVGCLRETGLESAGSSSNRNRTQMENSGSDSDSAAENRRVRAHWSRVVQSKVRKGSLRAKRKIRPATGSDTGLVSFQCYGHLCLLCRKPEPKLKPKIFFYTCIRCPRMFHRKCLDKFHKFLNSEKEKRAKKKRSRPGRSTDSGHGQNEERLVVREEMYLMKVLRKDKGLCFRHMQQAQISLPYPLRTNLSVGETVLIVESPYMKLDQYKSNTWGRIMDHRIQSNEHRDENCHPSSEEHIFQVQLYSNGETMDLLMSQVIPMFNGLEKHDSVDYDIEMLFYVHLLTELNLFFPRRCFMEASNDHEDRCRQEKEVLTGSLKAFRWFMKDQEKSTGGVVSTRVIKRWGKRLLKAWRKANAGTPVPLRKLMQLNGKREPRHGFDAEPGHLFCLIEHPRNVRLLNTPPVRLNSVLHCKDNHQVSGWRLTSLGAAFPMPRKGQKLQLEKEALAYLMSPGRFSLKTKSTSKVKCGEREVINLLSGSSEENDEPTHVVIPNPAQEPQPILLEPMHEYPKLSHFVLSQDKRQTVCYVLNSKTLSQWKDECSVHSAEFQEELRWALKETTDGPRIVIDLLSTPSFTLLKKKIYAHLDGKELSSDRDAVAASRAFHLRPRCILFESGDGVKRELKDSDDWLSFVQTVEYLVVVS